MTNNVKKGENLKYPVRQKAGIVAIIFLTSMLIYAQFVTNTQAQECAVKVVAPTEILPNTNFNVSIVAENIPNQEGGMAGWELVLSWTPGVINCTGETLNYAFWPANSGPLVAYPIDNTVGTYHQALGLRAPSTPVIGTYWLVNMTFKSGPTISEVTNLTLSPAEGLTYLLIDKWASDIPHDLVDAENLHIVPEFLEIMLLPLLMILTAVSITLATKIKKRQ